MFCTYRQNLKKGGDELINTAKKVTKPGKKDREGGKMKTKKLLLSILILATTLLMAYQGDIFAPPSAKAMDVTVFEHNDNWIWSYDYASTTRWLAQTFTPEVSHIIKSVRVKIKKIYPIKPYVYITICPVEPTHNSPLVSQVLASGSYKFRSSRTYYDWIEVGLGDGALLQAGVTYAIVLRTSDPTVHLFYWYKTLDRYPGGVYWYSTNYGQTWGGGTGPDMLFEEWGILPSQEPQMFANYGNTAGPGAIASEPFQVGQTFIPQKRHILSRIYLHGYVPFEYEAQFTVKIFATSGCLPVGAPLATASVPYELLPLPGEDYWITVEIPQEPELQAGVMYAIVVSHTASQPFGYRWTTDTDDEDADYTPGTMVKSSDGGASWMLHEICDCCFQEWGYPLE